MTKKLLMIGVAAVLVASTAIAQNGRVAYSATKLTAGDSGTTEVFIPAGAGVPFADSFNYSSPTGAAVTLTLYRPDICTHAQSAVDGDTNVLVFVDSTTTNLQGYTITTSDYLVFPASGSSNATLAKIDTITTTGVGTNGYIKITCATPFTVASNGVVCVAKNGNNQSIGVGTTATVGNPGAWVGYDRCPVVISVPSNSGAFVLSGVASYW